MPVNPGIDFKLAEEEYRKASIDSEKLKALEHMYATCPKHKGTGPILKEIKTKISKLREKIEKSRKQKSGGYSYHIKKEGAAQIILVGITNSGKSSLLSQLTNSKPEIANYEYTTKQPEIGTMDHHGIKLQIIEFPAIFEDCSDFCFRLFSIFSLNFEIFVLISFNIGPVPLCFGQVAYICSSALSFSESIDAFLYSSSASLKSIPGFTGMFYNFFF